MAKKKNNLLDRPVNNTVALSTLLASVLAVFFTVSGTSGTDSLEGKTTRDMLMLPRMERMQERLHDMRPSAPAHDESSASSRGEMRKDACATAAVETMQAAMRAAQEQFRMDLQDCRGTSEQ